MARHLAIFDKTAAEVLFSGKKKIDGRFSQIKIAPYGKVAAGDVVLVKIGGGKIVGQFTCDRVLCFDHPTNLELEEIKRKYGKAMGMPQTFWLDHEKVNYVTLMFIGQVNKFIIAPEIKKRDLRPWVVLEKI